MSDIPGGTITLADLYRELTGIRTDIVRALERVAAIDQRNLDADNRERTMNADMDALTARVTVLERFRWTLIGAATAISIATGFLSNYIIHVTQK